MKCKLTTHIVAPALVLAMTVGCVYFTAGRPGALQAPGIVSTRGETPPVVFAQYNPCPNGRCK
jgi:hypothetical protein